VRSSGCPQTGGRCSVDIRNKDTGSAGEIPGGLCRGWRGLSAKGGKIAEIARDYLEMNLSGTHSNSMRGSAGGRAAGLVGRSLSQHVPTPNG
jgi:hypothetical protein